MKKIHFLFIGLVLISGLNGYGVVPQKWELRTFSEFLEGKFEGISVTYEGILSLSPKEEIFEGPAEEFYLSLLVDSTGVAFLGTGHGGKIYSLSDDGKFELYFQVPEMDIYCLAKDGRGNLYAGTSPNGKIWKITEKGKGEVFFNTQERYIWDLEFTKNGFLLAAVGEDGGIYEINSDGEGRKILDAKENHILCIEQDQNGDLFAGSGGKGLIYRILEGYRISVLYESPYEEIKNIVLDGEGNIYVASGGKVTLPKAGSEAAVTARPATDVTITVSAEAAGPKTKPPAGKDQPSSLFKISPDGIAKTLWKSSDELIYTLFWDAQKRSLIFGTGKKGRIYAVDRHEKVSLLHQKDSEQIYLLVPYQGRIYTLANNPASYSVLYPEQRYEGVYTSRVYDTNHLSTWGKIAWRAVVPEGATLQIQTRSGNSNDTNQTWSDWSPPYNHPHGEQVLSPKARYIQFKALFKALSGRAVPRLEKVSLFYLQTNVAPVISSIELLPSNEVFLKPLEQEEVIWGQDLTVSEQAKKKNKDKGYAVPKRVKRKGFQTIRWEAEDDNGDSLLYSIYIRDENERQWRILKEGWVEKIFAFDTLTFPDGNYFIQIEATDSPSNPVGMELKTEKSSHQLVIDNSLPVVRNLQVDRKKDTIFLSFSAEDAFSSIKEVQFIVRPDRWKTVFPVDGICDSKKEEFELTVTLPQNSSNLLTIKVIDSRDNTGVARRTF